MEHVRTLLDRTAAFAQLAMYLIHKEICVLVSSTFTVFKLTMCSFLQILMNVSWEYMTAVGMLFVLTQLEGLTVHAKTTFLGMEDPV